MITQSTLISYHTEAFVKTEVGCTVHFSTPNVNAKDAVTTATSENKAKVTLVPER